MRAVFLSACLCIISSLTGAVDDVADPCAVMLKLDEIAKMHLWPGFDLQQFPVAFYTGDQTFLFRHPQPPEDFVRSRERDDLWVYEGRHPQMIANTTMEIGGVITATILLDTAAGLPLEKVAAVTAHEIFHAFQHKHHPGWRINTANQFIYPMDDTDNYADLILESMAFASALDSADVTTSAQWAAKALAIRSDRYSRLSDDSIGYERGVELLEGTAHYIEYSTMGEAGDSNGLLTTYPPQQIRLRLYATGRALAALLDRFDESWKEQLEEDTARHLDLLLQKALSSKQVAPANFSEEEIASAKKAAEEGVGKLLAERKRLREEVISTNGWRITLAIIEGDPLWPRGFDPLNLLYLGENEVFHKRFLRLGNSAGNLSMLNLQAITVAAGEHPLFNGVKKVIIAGFEGEPSVDIDGEKVEIKADGFELSFTGAKVEFSGKEVRISILE